MLFFASSPLIKPCRCHLAVAHYPSVPILQTPPNDRNKRIPPRPQLLFSRRRVRPGFITFRRGPCKIDKVSLPRLIVCAVFTRQRQRHRTHDGDHAGYRWNSLESYRKSRSVLEHPTANDFDRTISFSTEHKTYEYISPCKYVFSQTAIRFEEVGGGTRCSGHGIVLADKRNLDTYAQNLSDSPRPPPP